MIEEEEPIMIERLINRSTGLSIEYLRRDIEDVEYEEFHKEEDTSKYNDLELT